MKPVMSGLDDLIATETLVHVGGEAILLAPLKVGQLPAFLRAISPVISELNGQSIDWLALFGAHGDALLGAIAIAIRKPLDWVENLNADEALLLAARVMEVNADFFTRAVIPRLGDLLGQGAAMQGSTALDPAASTGLTSSSA